MNLADFHGTTGAAAVRAATLALGLMAGACASHPSSPAGNAGATGDRPGSSDAAAPAVDGSDAIEDSADMGLRSGGDSSLAHEADVAAEAGETGATRSLGDAGADSSLPTDGGTPEDYDSMADAGAPPLLGRNLLFSYAQVTTTGGTTASELRAGYFAFSASGSVEAQYFSYIPEVNASEVATPATCGPMNAPYGTGTCSPGPVHIASYQSSVDQTGTWSWNASGGALTVTVDGLAETWTLDHVATEYYVLSSVTSTAPNVQFTLTLGMGYGTSYIDTPGSQPISFSNLRDYSGEFYENNGGSTTSPYNASAPELNTSVFQMAPGEPDVVSYSDACSSTIWCESSMLVNYAPFSKLLVYVNGGHDFNGDGCFDEPGHLYTMYGVYDGTRIARFLFIEYSPQSAGFPIVGIGRYY